MIMKIDLKIVCPLIVLLMLSGCAMFSLSSNTVEVVMEPETTPEAPASIYINGDFMGRHHEGIDAPIYKLSCGTHRFKILAEGYVDWEKDLVVLKGNPHRLVALLRKQ